MVNLPDQLRNKTLVLGDDSGVTNLSVSLCSMVSVSFALLFYIQCKLGNDFPDYLSISMLKLQALRKQFHEHTCRLVEELWHDIELWKRRINTSLLKKRISIFKYRRGFLSLEKSHGKIIVLLMNRLGYSKCTLCLPVSNIISFSLKSCKFTSSFRSTMVSSWIK